MTPLTKLTAVAVPVEGSNIDTDRLLPARFLRKPRDENNNYQQWLFHDLRFTEDGQPIEDFVLNQSRYQNARIIVAGQNFGCGSSREGAVYALIDNGFRTIIAPSFGEIFASNCVRNGIAPLKLSDSDAIELRRSLETADTPSLTVNLPDSTVTDETGRHFPVTIDAFSKQCLIEGIDEITFTLQQAAKIDSHEQRQRQLKPWLFNI